MNRYDLQVHTDASPCSRASPERVAAAAVEAGLDGVAITNHDTLEGCEDVARHAPPELDVVPAVEVTTTQGHLLALDVREPPPQSDPLTVIDDVHDQGGLAVLSHPFDRLRQTYDADLHEIADAVDAVETCNSRCVLPRFNRAAREFAAEHDLPVTGGSDAHFPMEVGRAYTTCPGGVLDSVQQGRTRASGRGGYLSGHVATKGHQLLTSLR